MSNFQCSKLELALASEKLENEQLRQMIQQYQLAWECCEQGGNSSEQGVCSFEWQSKVIILLKTLMIMKPYYELAKINIFSG